jgi:hypothetical protein
MNRSGAESVNNQIMNSTSTAFRMYMNLLEVDFMRVIRFQLIFINDDDLHMLSAKSKLLSETDKREAIQRLQKRLQLLKMSSPFLVLDLSDDPPSAQKACRCVPFGGARKSGCRRPSSGQGEFSYLFRQFNDMVGEVKVLIHEVYEKNFRLRLSELRQLQSQINPHFLYNSFYSVYRMAKIQDYDKIMEFTKYLGDFFRFITRSDSDEVLLKEEWMHMRNYIEIQKVRFSNRIEVDFGALPEAAGKTPVPRLRALTNTGSCLRDGSGQVYGESQTSNAFGAPAAAEGVLPRKLWQGFTSISKTILIQSCL